MSDTNDVLESGWYLKCVTENDGHLGLLWLGPYQSKHQAQQASDALTDSPDGERTLLAFKVQSVDVVDRNAG